MYSGSCSSVRSTDTLNAEDAGEEEEEGGEAEDEEEEEEESTSSADTSSDEDDGDTLSSGDESESEEEEEENESEEEEDNNKEQQQPAAGGVETEESEIIDYGEMVQAHLLLHKSSPTKDVTAEDQENVVIPETIVVEESNEIDLSKATTGAAETASEIFRHLQATRDKEQVTTELAKILNVLETTLKQEEEEEEEEESDEEEEEDSSDSDDADEGLNMEQGDAEIPRGPSTSPVVTRKPPQHPNAKRIVRKQHQSVQQRLALLVPDARVAVAGKSGTRFTYV
jgi:hypothetical protein